MHARPSDKARREPGSGARAERLYRRLRPSYPPRGSPRPNSRPTVGATSTVAAAALKLPLPTRRWPPPMKNGIGLVAGWPWLPGIGLLYCAGSLNRQPERQ